MASEPGNEGLRFPMTERRIGLQAEATAGPAAQAGHLCRCRGLVDEDKAVRFKPHPRLTVGDPYIAPPSDLFAPALGCDQGFFYSYILRGSGTGKARRETL